MSLFIYIWRQKILLILALVSVSNCIVGQNKSYVSTDDSRIYLIDPVQANCDTTLVGETNLSIPDIALTTNGRLWSVVGGNLYEIDTLTANPSLVGPTAVWGAGLVGLNDSTLLIETNQSLYSINTNTGASNLVGSIGHQATGDLTWYDNDLYMSSGTNLIRINLGYAPLSISNVEIAHDQIPSNCLGLITISIPGGVNQLLCLSGFWKYKICPIDGTWSWFCTSPLPESMNGGESSRMPVQFPSPTACGPITGIMNHDNEDNLSVYPNPLAEGAVIKFDRNCIDCTMRLFDSEGRLKREQIVFGNQAFLDAKDLTDGFYLGRLSYPDGLIDNFKVLVKKN